MLKTSNIIFSGPMFLSFWTKQWMQPATMDQRQAGDAMITSAPSWIYWRPTEDKN